MRTGCAVAAAVWLSGCTGASDFLSKDAEWFSRPSRIFGNDLTVGTAPLSQRKAVAHDELIGADGSCVGVIAPEQQADPNAPPTAGGSVALDATECDVVRAAGTPNDMNIANNERGERSTVLTYLAGPRPGVYRFTGGRLTSMERAPGPPPAPPRAQKRRS
jgi:hypothetical protein